jgi:hypothetical protein
LINGLIALQQKIDQQSIRTVPWYQKDTPGEFIPVPVLGPDLVDMRQVGLMKERAVVGEGDPPESPIED